MLKPSCHRPVSQAGGGLKHKPDAEQVVDHEVDDVHQVVLARRDGVRRRQKRYGLGWAFAIGGPASACGHGPPSPGTR